jgi:hypothetical protein
LYSVATFTRHGYNNPRVGARDGASLYDNPDYVPPSAPGVPFGHKVSLPRPAGMRHCDVGDLPSVGWLERSGHVVEYCADLDVPEGPALLDGYRLLLSVGHDEYWSAAMRARRGVRAGRRRRRIPRRQYLLVARSPRRWQRGVPVRHRSRGRRRRLPPPAGTTGGRGWFR